MRDQRREALELFEATKKSPWTGIASKFVKTTLSFVNIAL